MFELQQAVDEYDFRQKQVAECDRKLQGYLAVLPPRTSPPADTPPPTTGTTGKKKKRPKQVGGGNAPRSFDLAAELSRVTGVDALRVEGINLITFQTAVAELGTDLGTWFPSEYHFASWLNLTPKRDVSGGKTIRHIKEPARNRVAGVLRLAAISLLRSDSYLGARFRNLRTRLGSPKAIKVMARYLACIIYRLFTKGQAWADRGAERFEQDRQTRDLAKLQARLTRVGSASFRSRTSQYETNPVAAKRGLRFWREGLSPAPSRPGCGNKMPMPAGWFYPVRACTRRGSEPRE